MQRRRFVKGCGLVAGGGLGVGAWSALSPFSRAGAGESQWPGWRGSSRNGILHGQKWPESVGPDVLKRLWSAPFSDSYSGPVLTDSFVITTESIKGNERVVALDRESGTEAWSHSWKGSHIVPFFAMRNGSWIRSTPVTDGETVYVGGIRDTLVAIDAKDGKEVWRKDFSVESGKVPDFGMASSPLIDGEYLYVQAGLSVQKVARADGTSVWKTLNDSGDIMSSGAFSSPLIAELNGVRQLIVQTRTQLCGVDLETGGVRWKLEIPTFRGMNILTPTIYGNSVFTSSYGGKSMLIDLQNESQPKIAWENKVEGYMSSPILLEDHICMHLKNKRFACINLASGKETWITKPFGEYWSMVSNGELILALDQTGELRLIRKNPSKFELMDQQQLTENEEESWAHICVSPNRIFVRSQKQMMAFSWPAQ